jgi:hypothetical protein
MEIYSIAESQGLNLLYIADTFKKKIDPPHPLKHLVQRRRDDKECDTSQLTQSRKREKFREKNAAQNVTAT